MCPAVSFQDLVSHPGARSGNLVSVQDDTGILPAASVHRFLLAGGAHAPRQPRSPVRLWREQTPEHASALGHASGLAGGAGPELAAGSGTSDWPAAAGYVGGHRT